MYILDTNVVSELMKAVADPIVAANISAVSRHRLYTTSITSAEIFAGVARLPIGRRRDGLQAAADIMFRVTFGGRVLPFDEAASRIFAIVTSTRRAIGQPIEDPDAQIAAIALDGQFGLVTRNTADFDHCGLIVVDSWTSPIP